MKGGSAAALGCFITLLDWYKDAEYDPSVETLSKQLILARDFLENERTERRGEDEDDSGERPKKLSLIHI